MSLGEADPVSQVSATADGARATAFSIARSLCDTAVWDEDGVECTWMGRSDVPIPDPTGSSVCSVALGAHLYAGSAGVGLFLGEASRLEDDATVARTAAGALTRSCRHLGHSPGPMSPLSFFSGYLGVAYAAHRLPPGPTTGAATEAADALLDRVRESIAEPYHLDLLVGAAGAIPALLVLAREEGLGDLADLAARLGEDLCRRALWSDGACSWDAREASGEAFECPPPTGLSHGASGIALALLGLHRATGDAACLATARGAFAYEDSLFSAEERNWVDTRVPFRQTDAGISGTFRLAWCHGAPGIALARARAVQCDPDRADEHVATTRTALDTTAAAAEQLMGVYRHDASLCHGLAGLAEVLWIGGTTIDAPEYTAAARAITGELMTRYAALGDWPSGAPAGGPNPSLMIGTAGIGHHLLRLAAPGEVSPILVVTP